MFGGKVSGYQLTIEAMLGAASSDNGKVTLICLSFKSYVLSILSSILHYRNETRLSLKTFENSTTCQTRSFTS